MKRIHLADSNARLYGAMLLIPLGAYLLLVFALTLPLNKILTNAVLSDTFLPDLLLILIELIELFTYAFGISLILYAAYRRTPSVSVCLGLIFICTIVLRYTLTVMSAGILYGFRRFWQWYFEPTLINNIPYCLLDILFVIAALLLSSIGANLYYRKHTGKSRGSLLKNRPEPSSNDNCPFVPFCKILDLRNPLQCSVFLLGCLLSAAKIFSDIFFDIQHFSSAQSVDFLDILSLLGSYVSDLIAGVIFYTVAILFILLWLYHVPKERSKKAKAESK